MKMTLPFTDKPFNVVQHIILTNGWEYYVSDTVDGGNHLAYVLGFEDELGYVNLDEIKPHILCMASDDEFLRSILPAPGCKWVE